MDKNVEAHSPVGSFSEKSKVRVIVNGRVLFKGSESAWKVFSSTHTIPENSIIEKIKKGTPFSDLNANRQDSIENPA